jgi:hypothetical protein
MSKKQKKKRLSGNQIVFFFALIVALMLSALYVPKKHQLQSNAESSMQTLNK